MKTFLSVVGGVVVGGVILMVAFALLFGGVATGGSEKPAKTEPAASTSGGSDTGFFDDVEAAPAEEPPPLPDPSGTYTHSCDYVLGDFSSNTDHGFRFLADARLKNTGNVGTVDEVRAVWFLSGGDKVVRTRTVRSEPGQVRRVGFEVPVGQDEIDRHQALGYNTQTCKVKVTTIDTFGQPVG